MWLTDFVLFNILYVHIRFQSLTYLLLAFPVSEIPVRAHEHFEQNIHSHYTTYFFHLRKDNILPQRTDFTQPSFDRHKNIFKQYKFGYDHLAVLNCSQTSFHLFKSLVKNKFTFIVMAAVKETIFELSYGDVLLIFLRRSWYTCA